MTILLLSHFSRIYTRCCSLDAFFNADYDERFKMANLEVITAATADQMFSNKLFFGVIGVTFILAHLYLALSSPNSAMVRIERNCHILTEPMLLKSIWLLFSLLPIFSAQRAMKGPNIMQ